jgi:hypothetical protein
MARSRSLAGIALCTLWAGAATGDAGTGSAAASVQVVGVAGDSDHAVAIGARGELWLRQDGHWSRAAGGTTAATLVAAGGSGPTDVWALGQTAPPYHFDGATWRATPVRRKGNARLSIGEATALSVGRRVYARTGAVWKERGKLAGGPSVSQMAASGQALVVLRDDGMLLSWASGWKPVPAPAGVVIDRLLAAPPDIVLALSGERIYRVQGDKLVRLDQDASAAGFVPPLATLAGGKLWLLGDQQGVATLARATGLRLAVVEALPAIAGGAAGLVGGPDGTLIVVTDSAAFWRRDATGAWAEEPLAQDAAASPPTENPPARVGPQ